jgi:hypothetical protein
MKYDSILTRAELDGVSLPPIDPGHAAQYRAKATMARQRAETASSGNMRQLLLNDSKLWDRMARYEEAARPSVSRRGVVIHLARG